MSTNVVDSARAKLLQQAEALVDKKKFTREDREQVDSLLDLVYAMPSSDAGEYIRKLRAAMLADELGIRRRPLDETEADATFRNYLLYSDVERPDMNVASSTSGGDFVPASFSERFAMMLKAHDGLFDAATWITTEYGSKFGYPELSDAASVATIVAEGVQSTETDPPLDGLILNPTAHGAAGGSKHRSSWCRTQPLRSGGSWRTCSLLASRAELERTSSLVCLPQRISEQLQQARL